MKALIYLTKRSLFNNLKRAFQKPTTVVALILGTVYVVFLLFSLGTLAATVRIDSARGLVLVVTVMAIYMTSANFVAYSGRKGIIFRPGHSHFVFTAPISPKTVLINSAWMNYLFSLLIWIILSVAGLTVFQVSPVKVLFFFLTGCVLEIAFEISLVIFLYTNDRVPEKIMKGICFGIKVFLAAFTLLAVFYFRKNGISAESAFAFADWSVLQMIPVLGWQISVYRLLLMGPTVLNVTCTAIYIICTVLSVCLAVRMKCDGGYYEEAAKFADDYAEIRKRQKNGETVAGISGKKRKFRHVTKQIHAHGAKAIFYRQYLEYRKEKYFIFSKLTLISAAVAFIFSYSLREAAEEAGNPQLFLLGVVAYVSIIMTGYLGKWQQELKNPYIYLIPDSPFKKMWYATLMEHVKAIADGSIICIPIGIFWHIRADYVIYCILIFTVLQANRLYIKVIAQCLLGDVFGNKGQDILRMLIQTAFLGIGILVAVIVAIFLNLDFIFPIVLIYSIMITVATGTLASLRFETMEQIV